MRLALALAGVVAALVSASASPAAASKACIVPRLYTLSPAAAAARLTASGCRAGNIDYGRLGHRRPVVTSQVPLPGAVMPAHWRVSIVVS
jgi:hypothetical protein